MKFIDQKNIDIQNKNILSEEEYDKQLNIKINNYKKTIIGIVDFMPNFQKLTKKFIDGFNKIIGENENLKVTSIKELITSFKNLDEIKELFKRGTGNIIERISNLDSIELDNYKDPIISSYTGELIYGTFDLKQSSKDPLFKEKAGNLFWLNNIFEKIFEDEGFRLFATYGDEINVGFFKDNIDNQNKINVLILFNLILDKFGYETNVFLNSIDYKKNDNLTIISGARIDTTINSHNFNNEFHRIGELHKQGKFQYGVGTHLLNYLGTENLKEMDGYLDQDFINIKPRNLYDLDEIKSRLTYTDLLNTLFGEKSDDFIEAIKHYYENNKDISKINTYKRGVSKKEDLYENDSVEIIEAEEDINIIEFGENPEYIFILKNGGMTIRDIMGNKDNSLIINKENTILGEMSLYNSFAIATVEAKKDSNFLKIPKKDFFNILGIGENIDQILMDPKYRKIIENYIQKGIKDRMAQNIAFIHGIEKIKGVVGKDIYYIFSTMLKNIINGEETEKVKNHDIITKGIKNNFIFFIKAGSQIQIDKAGKLKDIIMETNSLVGEGSYLNKNVEDFLPGQSIKVLDGEIKKISFSDFDKILKDNKLSGDVIKKIFETRISTPHFQK